MITKARVDDLYLYRPDGELVRKIRVCGFRAGVVAGYLTKDRRYRAIRIDGRQYLVHRIVWLMHHGTIPELPHMIDHVNRESLDNRIENLRICSRIQNLANARLHPNNKSGYRGVHRRPSGKWRAAIHVSGKTIVLGIFDDPAVAARAYDAARLELSGEYAHLNFP
jgi:hypothetical protein